MLYYEPGNSMFAEWTELFNEKTNVAIAQGQTLQAGSGITMRNEHGRLVTLVGGGAVGWPLAFTMFADQIAHASVPSNLDAKPGEQLELTAVLDLGSGVRAEEIDAVMVRQRRTQA